MHTSQRAIVEVSRAFSGLRGAKRELLVALKQCRTSECKQVQKDYDVGRLDENTIHYDKVSLRLQCCFLWWTADGRLTQDIHCFVSTFNHYHV